MATYRIAVGSDHAGFEGPAHYKPEVMAYLAGKGHNVINCGTDSADAVDYPDVAEAVSQKVLRGEADFGILICGTGIGMCMTANRHRGIRGAICTTPLMAKLSREHNAANVLCLGRRILSLNECKEIIDAWLAEPVSQVDRHKRRVEKMDAVGGETRR